MTAVSAVTLPAWPDLLPVGRRELRGCTGRCLVTTPPCLSWNCLSWNGRARTGHLRSSSDRRTLHRSERWAAVRGTTGRTPW